MQSAAKHAPSIPVIREPVDRLRDGDVSLRLAAMAPHPVEQVQAMQMKNALDADLYRAERVYGRHAAWEKRMDIANAATIKRLPGLPSSHAALDTLLHRDDKIGFEDIFGGERWQEAQQGAGGRDSSAAALCGFTCFFLPLPSPFLLFLLSCSPSVETGGCQAERPRDCGEGLQPVSGAERKARRWLRGHGRRGRRDDGTGRVSFFCIRLLLRVRGLDASDPAPSAS